MNEIDRLYGLPLAEFTPARNELAKQSKADRAAVGKLQKPNLPAWAVNQLYWHRRPVYDALIASAERARAAQAAVMGGRRADVAATESAHAAALKAAAQQIRQLLSEAGETASASTMIAVNETLQALPSSEPPGRLTRPLKPLGFEALTRLLAAGAPKSAVTILPFTSKTGKAETPPKATGETSADVARREQAEAKQQAEEARREAQARAHEAKKLEAALREARSAERAAEAAAARAKAAALSAEREHQELMRRVEEAADTAQRLRRETASKDRAATEASVARQRLEARLKALQ